MARTRTRAENLFISNLPFFCKVKQKTTTTCTAIVVSNLSDKYGKNDSTPRNVTVDGILSRRPTEQPCSRPSISAMSPFLPRLRRLNASAGLLMNFAPLSSLLCRHHNTCLQTCQLHPSQSAGKNRLFFYEKSRKQPSIPFPAPHPRPKSR